MTEISTSSGDLHETLKTLLSGATTVEDLSRQLFYVNVEQARSTDPELADLLLACAIPRRFDAQIVGVLRDAPEDSSRNEQLLAGLLSFTFVLSRSDGGYVYHDNTRDAALHDWQTDPARREKFDGYNARLVAFYEAQLLAAQQLAGDLGRVARVMQEANPSRYAQLSSVVETRVLTPLLEGLYHETLRSPEAGYDYFTRYYQAYERNAGFTVCTALAHAASGFLKSLPQGSGQEHWTKWIEYWKARLARSLRRNDEAEDRLRRLLPEAEDDVKLKLWVLGELGSSLSQQTKLGDALTAYQQELDLARQTREDPWNLPVSHSHVAFLHWNLGDLDQAVEAYREAVASAQEQYNVALEVYSRTDLSGVLNECGQWEEAFDEALQALHLARTLLPAERSIHLAVALRLMVLLAPHDPGLLDTIFSEAQALVEPTGDPLRALELRKQYVDGLRDSGQVRRADEVMTDLMDRAAQYTDSPFGCDLLFTEALLRDSQGRRDEAVQIYSRIIDLAEAGKSGTWNLAAALSNRGILNADRGSWAEAESDLQAAQNKWEYTGHDRLKAYMQIILGNLERRRGRMREAQRLIDHARDVFGETTTGMLADCQEIQGRIYREQARYSEAAEVFGQAAAMNRRLSRFAQAARLLGSVASCVASDARWEEASGFTAEANALWKRLAVVNSHRPSTAMERADEDNSRGVRSFTASSSTDRRQSVVRARDLFRSAHGRARRNCWYLLNLAYACAELGEWDEATQALETILDRGPEYFRCPVLYQRLEEYRLAGAAAETQPA